MIKMTLPALALVVLCTSAFAAEPAMTTPAPSAATCAALEKQYDAAKKDQVSAETLKKAGAKRTKGASECTSGKITEGVKTLKSALKMIGSKS